MGSGVAGSDLMASRGVTQALEARIPSESLTDVVPRIQTTQFFEYLPEFSPTDKIDYFK